MCGTSSNKNHFPLDKDKIPIISFYVLKITILRKKNQVFFANSKDYLDLGQDPENRRRLS